MEHCIRTPLRPMGSALPDGRQDEPSFAGDRRADADGTAFTEVSQPSYHLDGIETDAATGTEGDPGARRGIGVARATPRPLRKIRTAR